MVVLKRRALWLAPLVGAAACNALVGVDFGEAHLGDAGSDATTVPDAGVEKDGGHPDARDAHVVDAREHDAVADRFSGDASDAPGSDSPFCNTSADPAAEPCLVSDQYGVFVAPTADGGSDANTGSQAAPFATIGNAIANANGKRIYVCSATFSEALVVTANGTSIYGGFACPGGAMTPDAAAPWSYTGVTTVVTPISPGYALDVEKLGVGATFEDLTFESLAATSATASSSIAVLVNGSTGVSFTRVTAKAGAAATGATGGATGLNNCPLASLNGLPNSALLPGASQTCMCPTNGTGTSTSGAGKPAGGANTPAETGSSTPATNPILGLPGSEGIDCTVGEQGAPGTKGSAGAGGLPGTLSASGWAGVAGGSGTAGTPGQGGGGGGAVHDPSASGGIGGCGGLGAAGGVGGGASIGVAIVMSSVSFSALTLVTSTGGAGGTGQVGGAGQLGGAGGIPTLNLATESCEGGPGGTGGGGGGGGGGAGGPSVGIAWTGTTPVIDGSPATTSLATLPMPSSFTGGTAGPGGLGGTGGASVGGNGGDDGATGQPGVAAAVIQL